MDDFLQGNPTYAKLVLSSEYEDLKKTEIAARCGVVRQTIYEWEKMVDWDWVLQERRKKYAKELCAVDAAVLREAKKGSNAQAQLAYQRWDDWTPTSRLQSEHSIGEKDIDEAINALIERKRAAVDSLNSSAVDGARSGDPTAVDCGENQAQANGAIPVLQAQPSADPIHPGDKPEGSLHSD